MREMAPQDKRTEPQVCSKKTLKQFMCFFGFGLLCLMFNVIVIAASPDVLSGTSFPTSSVVISDSLPNFLLKLIAPWFMQKVSYLKRVVAIVSLCLMGLIVLVTAAGPFWRLVGVVILCLGSSFGEITFLALTSHHDHVTVIAFIAGVGCSSVIGTIYYTGLTTWACVSPRIAIAMTIPGVLFFLVLYAVLDSGQDQKMLDKEHYMALSSDSDPDHSNDSDLEFYEGPAPAKTSEKSITKEQFATAREIYPYISFIFVAYYAKGLINQSVATTIAFDHSPFRNPRDHYQYYSLSREIGDFLGRTYILIAVCACPSLLPYILIKRTWILTVVQLGHLLFFVFCSWYRFVPHVSLIIILFITSGFTMGSIYVNSACTVNDLISDSCKKEFALGLFTVGDHAGLLTAGLMGLYVEPMLREHCLYDLRLGELCLTRYASESGWTNARICT